MHLLSALAADSEVDELQEWRQVPDMDHCQGQIDGGRETKEQASPGPNPRQQEKQHRQKNHFGNDYANHAPGRMNHFYDRVQLTDSHFECTCCTEYVDKVAQGEQHPKE